ncbi:MAG: glycosyltransferase [Propionibacteriaceae bacterium]|nr:glycosyltransferase [Propionibacteriaceae bacterium]
MIAVYNTAAYLPEFLASLRGQTAGSYSVEYIFVDDGSTDESAELIQQWLHSHASKDAVTGLLVHQDNAGPSAARNTGMRHASGDWVTFPDSDDYLSDGYFAAVADFLLAQSEANLEAVDVPVVRWVEDKPRPVGPPMFAHKYVWGSRVVDLREQPNCILPHAHAAFFLMAALREHGVTWTEPLCASEDMLFVATALGRVEEPRVGILVGPSYYYRQRVSGTSLSRETWLHPERTIERFQVGYLPLATNFLEADGRMPSWIANCLLYDFKWLLEREITGEDAMRLPLADLDHVVEILAQVLHVMRKSDIDTFNVAPLDEQTRAVLLAIRDADFVESPIRVVGKNGQKETIAIRYMAAIGAPPVAMVAGDESVYPRSSSTTYLRAFGRTVAAIHSLELSIHDPLSATLVGERLPFAIPGNPGAQAVMSVDDIADQKQIAQGTVHTPTAVGVQDRFAGALATGLRREGLFEYHPDGDGAHGPRLVEGGDELVIACILDRLSEVAFAPECQLLQLRPDSWATTLDETRPDLLLVESAWRGTQDSWYDVLYQCPQEIIDITQWCKERGIPTVFWNKEDPLFYDRWIKAAACFDWVFTTELGTIGKYVRDLGHSQVRCLPFATQPTLFNPMGSGKGCPAAVFAGSHQAGFKERMADLFGLIDATFTEARVDILDRNQGIDHGPYRWPDKYGSLVVGSADAADMATVFKQYSMALNVNTVKNSETMCSRRVFDLLACGVPVLSNYARGITTLVGDAVCATDSPEEAQQFARESIRGQRGMTAVQAAGMRKVFRQHTYRERLRYVWACVSGGDYHVEAIRALFLVSASSSADWNWAMETVRNQEGVDASLIVVSDQEFPVPAGMAIPVRRVTTAEACDLTIDDVRRSQGVDTVIVISPEWTYGDEYAQSLLQAFQYSEASVIAKSSLEEHAQGASFIELPSADPVAWARSCVKGDCLGATLATVVRRGATVGQASGAVLVVDPYEISQNGAESEASRPHPYLGLGIEDILQAGELIARKVAVVPGCGFPEGEFPARTGPGGVITLHHNGATVLVSDLDDEEHLYVPCAVPLGYHDMRGAGVEHRVHLTTEGTGDVRLNVSWLRDDGSQIPGYSYAPNADVIVKTDMPDDAVAAKCFVYVKGKSLTELRSAVVWSPGDEIPVSVPRHRVLLVCSGYPAYKDRYRNGFIHSRVRAYRQFGFPVDVFVIGETRDLSFREYEGQEIISGSERTLSALLATGKYDHVAVHFLTPWPWLALQHFRETIPMTVWIHGYEAQPWWRRMFDYTNPKELEAAKQATGKAMEVWQQVFAQDCQLMRFVFVSDAFSHEVIEDFKEFDIEFPQSLVSTVHNPIDTNVFRYVPKGVDARKKILLVRPFASLKYGNDLAVKAILALSGESFFGDLEFRIVGSGKLFAETVKPLREFSNVTIHEGMLSHAELAALYQEYGIFLVPTRVDAQGVSRDEASSCGMVPVTNGVAAVKEFCSPKEGFLAPEGDFQGLADAIKTMYGDPRLFRRLSAAAAARVRRQTAIDIIIPKEIALLSEGLAERAKAHDA